jgi:hypothetical protein
MSSSSQRNSNTLVQGSSFNGGNLAQSFNLQGMRVVKGYAYIIPPEYAYASPSNYSVFINPYDGSALFLSCGDVILSAVIENYGSEITSTRNSATIEVRLASIPTLNSEYNIWQPGDSDLQSFSNNKISIQNLNSGYNIPLDASVTVTSYNGSWPVGYNTPLFYNNWVNCVLNKNYDTITSPNPIVKLTMLVLNSFNA